MRLAIKQMLAVMVLGLAWAETASAQQYWDQRGPRYRYGYPGSHHYYGPYKSKGGNYHTFYYYYRPKPSASKYDYHTVFYYPKTVGVIRGGYYYYKNRKTGKYWGRCMAGSSNYELLAEPARRANIEEINEGDFQPKGRMTPVPEMQPETPLVVPPKDPTPNGPPQE